MLRKILIGLVVVVAAIALWNAPFLAPALDGAPRLIAHRGQHQNFDRTGLTNDSCTATMIREPIVREIENTLPAMQAALAAGAYAIELDVHPTTDGQFAVFHDWTLDCRTEGTGETRSHDMEYLKTLDVGYGYTADGGKSFPLRGTGIGMMPELAEVLAAMPEARFVINFKSNEAREGDMLGALVSAHTEWRDAVWGAYGGDPPTNEAKAKLPDLKVWTRKGPTACLLQYEGYGWTGFVPPACRNAMVMVPINVAPFLWGWPNLFLKRMADVGTDVIVTGPFAPGDPGVAGIDSAEDAAKVPAGFPGYVWTNEIATIAPLLKPKS
ncbi:MAG: glycerophosphodiester phosphodiesterase family protein [Devosia sp.]